MREIFFLINKKWFNWFKLKLGILSNKSQRQETTKENSWTKKEERMGGAKPTIQGIPDKEISKVNK